MTAIGYLKLRKAMFTKQGMFSKQAVRSAMSEVWKKRYSFQNTRTDFRTRARKNSIDEPRDF